jgi:hypothetical protein
MRARTLETAEFQMDSRARSSRGNRKSCPALSATVALSGLAGRRPLTLEHVLCVVVGVGRPDDVSRVGLRCISACELPIHRQTPFVGIYQEERRNHVAGFFGTAGTVGRAPTGNQLSRTFQACFTESQGFRDAVFSTLHDVCGLKLPDAAWECLTNTTLLWLEARVRAATALTASASLSFSRR